MISHSRFVLLVPSILLLLISGRVLAAPISGYEEGWNVTGDTAGWMSSNSTLSYVNQTDTGGNPDGYLFAGGTGFQYFDIGAYTALPSVTGDFGASGTAWRVSFDLLYISGTYDDAWLGFRYQDAGYNGWKYSIGTDFTTTSGWTTYDIVFDPSWTDAEALAAGWAQNLPAPDWSTNMSDVYTTEVRLSGSGNLKAGIDNFRLTAVSVPAPGALLLLLSGLAAMIILRRSTRRKVALT